MMPGGYPNPASDNGQGPSQVGYQEQEQVPPQSIHEPNIQQPYSSPEYDQHGQDPQGKPYVVYTEREPYSVPGDGQAQSGYQGHFPAQGDVPYPPDRGYHSTHGQSLHGFTDDPAQQHDYDPIHHIPPPHPDQPGYTHSQQAHWSGAYPEAQSYDHLHQADQPQRESVHALSIDGRPLAPHSHRYRAEPPRSPPSRRWPSSDHPGHHGQYIYDEDHGPPQSHRRSKTKRRRPSDQQQIQVVLPDRQKDSGSISEQIQMMMMGQMMAQQMTAQQMQFAQMNAMMQAGNEHGRGDTADGAKKKKRPTVNIKSKQRKSPRPVPLIVAPPATLPIPTVESGAAMENWQEATIILCFAIIGVIYLVMNRSSKEEEKEASLAAKHLVPKPK